MLLRSLIMTSGLCANAEQPSAFTGHSVHWQNSCVLLVSTNHTWLIDQCTLWLVSVNVFPQYATWPHTVVSWAHTVIGDHTYGCLVSGTHTWLFNQCTQWLVTAHGCSVSSHCDLQLHMALWLVYMHCSWWPHQETTNFSLVNVELNVAGKTVVKKHVLCTSSHGTNNHYIFSSQTTNYSSSQEPWHTPLPHIQHTMTGLLCVHGF